MNEWIIGFVVFIVISMLIMVYLGTCKKCKKWSFPIENNLCNKCKPSRTTAKKLSPLVDQLTTLMPLNEVEICGGCGEKNQSGSKWCMECGVKIEELYK